MGFVSGSTREDKVLEFRRAAGKTSTPEIFDPLILDCIDEEFEEFQDAVDDWHTALAIGNASDKDNARRELVKEWADLQYVVSQAAVYYDIPADAALNRVHASNMTKVSDNGKIIFREDGKILKPATYVKPDMGGL